MKLKFSNSPPLRRLGACAMTAALAGASIASAAELFGPSSINLPTGGDPAAVAAADFDGDGFIDLAVASRADDAVTVLRGDGTGGFSPAITIPLAGDTPEALRAADLDDDGAADLVVANSNSGSLSIVLSDGEGGFRDPVEEPVGGFPFSLALGDLNRDGVEDVVVPDLFGGTLRLRAGNGAGGFLPLATLDVEGFPLFVTIDDVDGNGVPDLIYTDFFAPSVNVWLGNAASGFGTGNAASSIQPVGEDPRWISVADFDGDGRRDLAVAESDANTVALLAGNGDGTFRPSVRIEVAAGPRALAVGDFDSSGSPDLAVLSGDDDLLTLLINDGLGNLSRTRELSVGGNPTALIAAQLDRERSVDLAVVSGFNDAVRLLLGDGIGDFARAPEVAVGSAPTDAAAADLDLDGFVDVVTADFAGDTLSILRGDGIGGFAARVALGVGRGPRAVAAARLDGDDLPDLAVANLLDDTLSILLANGDGGYSEAPESPIGVGDAPFALLHADFDGDGFTDLAVANSSGADVSLLMGRGDGRFRVLGELSTGVEQGPWSLAAADLDGDLLPDLIAVSTAPPRIDVFGGTGDADRPFEPGSAGFDVDRSPYFVLADDLNRDGKNDLITVDRFDDAVTVRLNDGRGRFSLSDRVTVGGGPSVATLTDMNNDDAVDLAVVNELGDSVTVLLGTGDGRLVRDRGARGVSSAARSVHPDLSVARAPIAIVSADVDLDERPDLVVSCSGSDTVSLLRNRLDERADPNDSNRVDGFDVSEIGRRIGKHTPDVEYQRRTDVDINGVIDGRDLMASAARFGELQREVSLLRLELLDGGAAGPGEVFLRVEENVGDTLTLSLVADAADTPVAAADFSLTFEPASGESQVLEVVGFRPGDCIAGGKVRAYDVIDTTPGRVDVAIGSLPPEAVACRGGELLRLLLRARRAGTAHLEFVAFQEAAPGLIGLDGPGGAPQPIDGIAFAAGARVQVAISENGPPAQRIGVTPDALGFGTVPVDGSQRLPLRISNFGFSDLTVERASVALDCGGEPGPAPFEALLNGSARVPAFGYVELPMLFVPRAAGPSVATLRIESDDPLQPTICVPLTGRGAP